MASFQERLIYAESRVTDRILECRRLLSDVANQRNHPHQDDWDDALMVAYYKLDEASIYIEAALRALKEGA